VPKNPSPYKSKGGLRRISTAVGYSYQGLRAAIRHEAAFRQELLLALILVPSAFFLGRNALEVLLLISAVFLVLIVELINSAIEALADAITLESHPLLGRAKDLGSAAVFLALTYAAVVWLSLLILRVFF